jgi:hypothetical protein
MGDLNEQSWVQRSAVYKILNEGDEPASFTEKLVLLRRSNRELFDKLFQICRRLEFVENLRYIQSVSVSESGVPAFSSHIDRLCLYLTTTCIEIAASTKHVRYQEWLPKDISSDHESAELTTLLDKLENPPSRNIIKKSLKSFITSTTGRYYKQFGLFRAFRRFFTDLPKWLQEWVGQVYFLVDGNVIDRLFNFDQCKWLSLSALERCEWVADYLYEHIRSKHTHTAIEFKTLENGGLLGIPWQGNNYTFNRLHKDANPEEPIVLSVGLRKELTESNVLRLLLVYHLRSWLGIVDDPSFLDRSVARLHYRHAVFRLLKELEQNLTAIEGWRSARIYEFTPWHRWPRGLTLTLSKQAAQHMYHIVKASEKTSSLSPYLSRHLSTIDRINAEAQKVRDFIQIDENRSKKTEIIQMLEELSQPMKTVSPTHDEITPISGFVDGCFNIRQLLLQNLQYGFY